MEKGGKVILGSEAENFVSSYVPIPKSKLVKTYKDALKYSETLDYPIVLKIISKQAVHKTDIKGIRIIKKAEDFEKQFEDLLKISKTKKLKLDGILVQEYIEGKELIIGLKKDSTFGHVIMLGIGGIFVELLKDVSFRVCPITYEDAESMINELKMKKILFGYRNEKAVNVEALKNDLVKISKLPSKKDILELDINPYMINDREGKAVDVRILI
jgi:succinyl-CoA synthetase beta subunit